MLCKSPKALLVMATLAMMVAGCSGSKSRPSNVAARPKTSSAPSSVGAAGSSATPATFGSSASPSPAGKFGTKPTILVPPGPPPSQLQVNDLIVGTGPPAQARDMVTVQYVGVSYSTKREFDASWNRGQPFSFQLGVGSVIPGWDEGVVGMKVGGRRELIIPPSLAYGVQSPGPGIVANDTLIFVIDMVKIG